MYIYIYTYEVLHIAHYVIYIIMHEFSCSWYAHVCMYVCMYIHVRMHVCIYVHVCMYAYMHVCMPICMYVCTHVYL